MDHESAVSGETPSSYPEESFLEAKALAADIDDTKPTASRLTGYNCRRARISDRGLPAARLLALKASEIIWSN